ncbi:hypothetical protein [Aeromonas encheleia]|uniref:Uncharacterized protein n=2 Tax=Aeromonas TaxID=642 RepID=A0AAE9MH01_9GAMM|nr:hypothetical protein [Aeromonas encheleia]USV57481.1 hypothetical protein NHF51_19575 [Aeromonas encheleia]
MSESTVAMNYKVKLSLTVRNLDNTCFCSGSKELNLPFAPFAGLRLHEEMQVYTLAAIGWADHEQCFYASVEMSEEQLSDGDLIDMDFIVETAKGSGWVGFNKIFKAQV